MSAEWMRVLKLLILVVVMSSTGCASKWPPRSTLETTEQGVVCTKCQVTWVYLPRYGRRGRLIGYYWTKRDVCPDCKDAVESFIATGKFRHTCNTCGDTMEICKVHQQ